MCLLLYSSSFSFSFPTTLFPHSIPAFTNTQAKPATSYFQQQDQSHHKQTQEPRFTQLKKKLKQQITPYQIWLSKTVSPVSRLNSALDANGNDTSEHTTKRDKDQ